MSEENVEIVRRCVEGWAPGSAVIDELCDPQVDHRAIEGAPDDVGVIEGREALKTYYEQWYEMFDGLAAKCEEFVDAGDRVVVAVRVSGRMKGSDAPIGMRFGLVYTLRDGLIVRGREYATFDEARVKVDAPG